MTDAGLSRLEKLTSLRDVYLWRTGVTGAGAERLKTSLPRLTVVLGANPPMERNDATAAGKKTR